MDRRYDSLDSGVERSRPLARGRPPAEVVVCSPSPYQYPRYPRNYLSLLHRAKIQGGSGGGIKRCLFENMRCKLLLIVSFG